MLCVTPGQGVGLLQWCVCTAAACVGHPVDPELQAQPHTRWAVRGHGGVRDTPLLTDRFQEAGPTGLQIASHRSSLGAANPEQLTGHDRPEDSRLWRAHCCWIPLG